jgi:MFS transporter, FSR family, fosmidomycin resistance protein
VPRLHEIATILLFLPHNSANSGDIEWIFVGVKIHSMSPEFLIAASPFRITSLRLIEYAASAMDIKRKAVRPVRKPEKTSFPILGSVGFSHFLNDMVQSLILASYPLLKSAFSLSYARIGLITLVWQCTASMLQPFVGFLTDRRPLPYSLFAGMGFTLCGLLMLAFAPSYLELLIAAALFGLGSSIFHPESSRVARMASGGHYGLSQSIFQVGGNMGTALGPVLAAWVVLPNGRSSAAWFSIAILTAMCVLFNVGRWYQRRLAATGGVAVINTAQAHELPNRTVAGALLVLLLLIFSKFFYMASFGTYYIFYLISRFHLSIQSAQYLLFIFLFAVALGTIFGGPIGDRIGRKRVIWFSILGAAPFSLVLPYAGLEWTCILTFIIGLILSSAFPAIVVFAQELLPGKIGMVSGLFFGLAFGIGGIGAAAIGRLADFHGIEFVYRVCSFLPLIGLLTVLLPDLHQTKQ